MARSKSRGNGEGSIYRRKDGRWCAVISVGFKPDGKSIRKSFYGRTRKEVADKLNGALREKGEGILVTPNKVTVGEYMAQWLEHARQTRIRERTYYSYESYIRLHIAPALGRIPLQGLITHQVQTLVDRLQAKGLARASAIYCHSILHRALNHAKKLKLITGNPADDIEFPKAMQTEMQALDEGQAHRLLAAVRGDRLEAYYRVSMALGLRRGEALGLTWQDVDLDSGRLTIRQSLQSVGGQLKMVQLKTEMSYRTLVLPPTLRDVLREHRCRQFEDKKNASNRWQDSDLVFTTRYGTPYHPQNMRPHFLRLLQRANLPPMRIHDLRHSAASLMRAQGIRIEVISRILGHANISTTNNIYMHIFEADKQDAARLMDDFLKRGNQGEHSSEDVVD